MPDERIGRTYMESSPWWPDQVKPRKGAPNIVVVLLDDVGYGSLGCYGSEIDTSHIDALAGRGIQYTNFHVTALCSPTRASLLTGRNHHSVGMSLLSNADSGFPGKRGNVSHSAATIAEVLRDQGYNTAAFGKWHIAPIDQTTAAGPYDQWPLGRGFERYYGFLEGITDHFYPELVRDNQRAEPPATPGEGYHLSADLVDNAIEFVSDQHSAAPDKPFLLYLAFGAGHTPHQAPPDYLAKYRGSYDEGWDAIRQRRHRRQIQSGVIPQGTELAPRNDGVLPWVEVPPDQQRFMARMQEAFAAMLDHADDQIGRLVQHLAELEVLDNTLILVLSDNGASQEGGPQGCVNTIAYENGDTASIEQNMAAIGDIGGPASSSNYPWGWAQAGNTPLKRYKQNTHAGGVRAPLVIALPKSQEYEGGTRSQFHSVIDIAPTLLDLVGVQMPEEYKGVAQMPVHGISMVYSFLHPNAESHRDTQYFEMYGHRAIWHEGWKAVAFHERGTSYDDDRWELYHLDVDFSECRDLSDERPDILNSLIGRWWSEAERYGVFPLDDRNFAERAAKYQSAASPRRKRLFTFYPGMSRIPGGVTPLIYNRSHAIEAHVKAMREDEGVLVSQGDINGGYTLFMKDSALWYEYNHQGKRYLVGSGTCLPEEISTLSMRFTRTGELRGIARLYCNEELVGQGSIDSTARYLVGWQGLVIGRDALSPVGSQYRAPFPFEGSLESVTYRIHDDAEEVIRELID